MSLRLPWPEGQKLYTIHPRLDVSDGLSVFSQEKRTGDKRQVAACFAGQFPGRTCTMTPLLATSYDASASCCVSLRSSDPRLSPPRSQICAEPTRTPPHHHQQHTQVHRENWSTTLVRSQ